MMNNSNFFKHGIIALILGTASLAGASQKSVVNPNFTRKLADPAHYVAPRFFMESICGTNNLQEVESYDGAPGQPVEFVAAREPRVGAIASGSPEHSDKYCTGTLISENLFLTASHCVDSSITNDFVVFNYQKVRGTQDLEPQDHVHIVGTVEQTLGGLDYAIIRLEGLPGLKYGYAHLNPNEIENGHMLTIIQHPSGNPKMVDVGHRSGSRETFYMTYGDLDTQPGSSGSGVLDQLGNVVGVHTNGGCFNSGGENAGVMMTEIVKNSPTIQALLKTQN